MGHIWQFEENEHLKQSFITFPTKAKGSFNKDQSSLLFFLLYSMFLFLPARSPWEGWDMCFLLD
jgi:hypothetical protein